MNIYVAHSTSFDFKKELYDPIRKSALNKIHNFVLPHEHSTAPYNSKEFFNTDCDLVIADVSNPSIGLGIELGWADKKLIPIICIYKRGSELSGSLKAVSQIFLEYGTERSLISAIEKGIDNITKKK